MSKYTHTQGPWSYWPQCGRVGGMVTQDSSGVHICAPTFYSTLHDVSDANARLIAAAPDLLEVCEEMLNAMKRYEMDVDEEPPYKHTAMMKRARAAIAKAKGEAL